MLLFLDLAIECFEKSRRGIPLYPLQTLRTFQILFNSGHSSPYFDTSHLNLKRSRSSVTTMLHSFYRDDADTGDDKTTKVDDVSRNYTTSVVFDPHDDPDFAPNPVSMFDLNIIEYRKLLIYRSDLTNLFSGSPKSLSGTPKSLPTLKMSPSPTGSHYEVRQGETTEQVIDSSANKTRSSAVQGASDDQCMADDKLTNSKTAVDEDGTPETNGRDLGSSPKPNATKATSGKPKATATATDLSTASENSSTAEVKPGHKKSSSSRPNSRKSTTSSTVSVADWSSIVPMTFERTYTGWLSVGNKFIKPQSATENLSELHPVTENQDRGLATTNQSKAAIVSDKFNRSHVASDRTKSHQLRDNDALRHQLTRSLHNLSNQESTVRSENSQSQFASIAGKVRPDPMSDSLAFVDSTKSLRQTMPSEFSYPRPGTNAFMKPIQLLPCSNCHHDKRNGSLDLFLEQLEKDLAKAKFHHTVSYTHGSYQPDSNSANPPLSSDNTTLSHSNYHNINQEFAYYDAASASELRSTTVPDYRQIVEKSKALLPKIYPRLTLNIPPKKDDKKAYLSPQVFSVHSYGNGLGTSHHQHLGIQSEEARYYHSSPVNEHFKDSQDKKTSRRSDFGYMAGAFGNETSDRHKDFPVDNKSSELKGETLLKERRKSLNETTTTSFTEPKFGPWGRKVSEASNPETQDFRDSRSSRLHVHDFSQVSTRASRRVFPDPNVWATEFHNSTMSSSIPDNLVTSFKAHDSSEKDWGHFTVVSPK